MIADAPVLPAPPQAAPGSPPSDGGSAAAGAAGAAASFAPLLLGKLAGAHGNAPPEPGGPPGKPPGGGKPKASGARTAQSEGADKKQHTDSAGPVAPQADPLAAALLQVSLPVPVSGAPTHTDDAQEHGAGAHDAGSIGGLSAHARSRLAGVRPLPLGPTGPAAATHVETPQLSQDAAVDAARPVADPATRAAAAAHAAGGDAGHADAARQLGGTAAAGVARLTPAGARGATDPAAPPLRAPSKKDAAPRLAGAKATAPVAAAHKAPGGGAAHTVSSIVSAAPAVDATAAPSGSTAAPAQGSVPTARSTLSQLPASAQALLQVATGATATRARIVLTPPELGKVEIRLRYTADGVSATFHSDSPQAAQSLAGAAGDLRRSLEQAGIPVVRIDVPPATASASDQQSSAWLSGGGADPGYSQSRGGGSGPRPEVATTMSFEPDNDQSAVRTVLLGTGVDVLA